MKKKLSVILAFVLAFCMSIPVIAAPSEYPTDGDPAENETTFIIEKKYVKLDGNTAADKFPAETLQFESTCTAAPMELAAAPNLTVEDLEVTGAIDNIEVKVPAYEVPGKYNYEIKEVSPAKQDPIVEDSAGVVYDKESVYIQVVVKYDNGDLKKYVTVTSKNVGIGVGNNLTQEDANKKGDFKNKYLLDGEIIPGTTDPEPGNPEGPNPIPDPNKPEPDPVTPIPPVTEGEEDQKPEELAKFKIMKQVRGPLASRDKEFTVTVVLKSKKPVRSDITYGKNQVIKKADAPESSWSVDGKGVYSTKITLSIKNGQTVEFKGVPAGVSYVVRESGKHIGQLTDKNINDPSTGYTVAYYGGGVALDNPTVDNAAEKEYGKNLAARGTVGYDKNNNIIIANSKGMNAEDENMVKPNTGISLDSLPYMMILGLVVLGAGMMIAKSRKRREE